ncbi:hypothetical protein COBT_000271 [Conglomerata obtusa]
MFIPFFLYSLYTQNDCSLRRNKIDANLQKVNNHRYEFYGTLDIRDKRPMCLYKPIKYYDRINESHAIYKRQNIHHDQHEDYPITPIEIKSFNNVDEINAAIKLDEYKPRNIRYASKFHFLLQTVLPGISNLDPHDIARADNEKIIEINRLRIMIIIKAVLAKISHEIMLNDKDIALVQNEIRVRPEGMKALYVSWLNDLYTNNHDLMQVAQRYKADFDILQDEQTKCL